MSSWEKVHEEGQGQGRGRWTWRLAVEGGWLVLVRVADDAVWGGLAFVPDPDHRCPPAATPDPPA